MKGHVKTTLKWLDEEIARTSTVLNAAGDGMSLGNITAACQNAAYVHCRMMLKYGTCDFDKAMKTEEK